MRKYSIYLLLICLTNFIACEVVNPANAIREGILITWKVSEVKIGIGETNLTTVYSIDDPKFIVDYASYRLTFNEDNTYFKIDEYGWNFQGIWEFALNDTKILFDKGIDITDIALILEFDSNNLVLQFEEENKKLGNMNRIFYFIPE